MTDAKAFHDILSPDCLLGENPVWYKRTGEFFWTDILRGIIYAYAPDTKQIRTVLETPHQIGAFLVDQQSDLILFTEAGVLLAKRCENSFAVFSTPLWNVPFDAGERFNDAIADPAGNLLSGSKRANNTQGKLYRFSAGKNPEVLLDHLQISNGMGFSPDGRTLYHTDSVPSVITAYDYTPDGPLRNPRIVLSLDPSIDPDGMTVDKFGNLWIVLWGGAKVIVCTPDGEQISEYEIGAKQCSSICFGGSTLSDAFVTSASICSAENGASLGGSCFYAKNIGYGKQEFITVV